jgi:hypothetical protein
MSAKDKIQLYKSIFQKKPTSQHFTKEQKQKQKQTSRDTSNDLDWFKEFPITEEMKHHTKLDNKLALQLLEFIKLHLINVYPGKIIKQATENKPASKFNYMYLIKTLAGQRPKFLTDFIYENNPSTNQSFAIPFELIHSTLIALLKEFTITLFTHLNYPKIFTSYNLIPPYTISNRMQVALNFAHLHLILHNKYQTINTKKFYEDLKLYPIFFKLHYFISENSINQPLFKIQNNNKFNINISLNIPKQQFLQTFQILSLKDHLTQFKTWFDTFFDIYK